MRIDMYLCSVWGNMLAYLKCELAYFEFFSIDDIVVIKAMLLEQLKTRVCEMDKWFIRHDIAHRKTRSSVLVG